MNHSWTRESIETRWVCKLFFLPCPTAGRSSVARDARQGEGENYCEPPSKLSHGLPARLLLAWSLTILATIKLPTTVASTSTRKRMSQSAILFGVMVSLAQGVPE